MKRISIAGALLALCAVAGPTPAAADGGDLTQFGKLDLKVKDPPHGFNPKEFLQLHAAAENGDAEAQFGVGVMFAMGVIVTEQSAAEATALVPPFSRSRSASSEPIALFQVQ